MKKIIFIALACVILAGAGIGFFVWKSADSFLTTAPETPGQEVELTIRSGSSFDSIARLLKKHNVITDVSKFTMLAKYNKQTGSVQAGRFALHTGWTPDKVLELLVSGPPVQYRLHFREGLPWWEVAKAIEEQGFGRFDDVKQIIHDKEFLLEHHIPFENAEGFLFPETYLMDKPDIMTPRTAYDTVSRVVSMFWEKTKGIWPDGPPSPKELRKILILATLVEKETSVPAERARVAGVYANRMKRRMLMQADPTIIYGLGESFNGNITRKNLRDASNPYNTYVHPGLPPGPICSPGLEAIKAAINPEKHSYLYFVAKGDGSHYFSKTLKEHNAAVTKYQLRRR